VTPRELTLPALVLPALVFAIIGGAAATALLRPELTAPVPIASGRLLVSTLVKPPALDELRAFERVKDMFEVGGWIVKSVRCFGYTVRYCILCGGGHRHHLFGAAFVRCEPVNGDYRCDFPVSREEEERIGWGPEQDEAECRLRDDE